MLLRLLFTLLVALNIAVGAWLLWGQADVHGRTASDLDVPTLPLLSEVPAAAAAPVSAHTVSLAAAGPAPASTTAVQCLALGPFTTPQELHDARAALAGPDTRMRSRLEQTEQSRGWWVYLPATASRAQALEQARQLSAAGITDHFVVSSGDQPNTISLGLFKDPANAQHRREQVAAAGFPAQMSERTDAVPQYWLDLVIAAGARIDWRSRIADPEVGSHSASCF